MTKQHGIIGNRCLWLNRHQVIHIVIWLWNWSVCDKTASCYSHCRCVLEAFVTKQYQAIRTVNMRRRRLWQNRIKLFVLSVWDRSVCDKTGSSYLYCQCETEAFVTKQDQVICTVSVRQKRLWQNRIKLFVQSVWDRSVCDKTGSSYLHCQCETEVSVTVKPASSYSRCQWETEISVTIKRAWGCSHYHCQCETEVYVVWQLN